MRAQKSAIFLLLMFGLILLGVAGFSYWYYLQQWKETKDLYYANFKESAYLIMILGVTCIIASVVLFIRFPREFSSQSVYLLKECPYCGRMSMEDMKFCPYCGKTLGEKKRGSSARAAKH